MEQNLKPRTRTKRYPKLKLPNQLPPMSTHMQNLSDVEHNPPNQYDCTPSFHANFIADTSQVVKHACTEAYFFGDILAAPGPADPRISAQEVEEFWDNWINKDLSPAYDCQPIRGYWTFQDWAHVGENAVVIARYKSFQICVRAGPHARRIMFVP